MRCREGTGLKERAMQAIDRKKFFDAYREAFGALEQGQVEGLESLLTSLEVDERVQDLRWAAYMLATTRHETAKTFQPIREYGKGQGLKYGKPDPVTGKVYYGRGYVQLTWKDNYATMGAVLKCDLVNNPDLALDAAIAYRILSYGMRTGAFTGVGLNRYIHGDVCDYMNARKIINGLDVAAKIAGYAEKLELALKGAICESV
jgi:putative chitinase